MDIAVKVTGLEQLESALEEFGPKLARKALRKGMLAAAQVQVDAAKAKAPVMAAATANRQPGELRDSIIATIKFDARKGSVRGRVGPKRTKGAGKQDPGTWGLMEEFGSIHNKPQPYLRPAFDQEKENSVSRFAEVVKSEVVTMGQK